MDAQHRQHVYRDAAAVGAACFFEWWRNAVTDPFGLRDEPYAPPPPPSPPPQPASSGTPVPWYGDSDYGLISTPDSGNQDGIVFGPWPLAKPVVSVFENNLSYVPLHWPGDMPRRSGDEYSWVVVLLFVFCLAALIAALIALACPPAGRSGKPRSGSRLCRRVYRYFVPISFKQTFLEIGSACLGPGYQLIILLGWPYAVKCYGWLVVYLRAHQRVAELERERAREQRTIKALCKTNDALSKENAKLKGSDTLLAIADSQNEQYAAMMVALRDDHKAELAEKDEAHRNEMFSLEMTIKHSRACNKTLKDERDALNNERDAERRQKETAHAMISWKNCAHFNTEVELEHYKAHSERQDAVIAGLHDANTAMVGRFESLQARNLYLEAELDCSKTAQTVARQDTLKEVNAHGKSKTQFDFHSQRWAEREDFLERMIREFEGYNAPSQQQFALQKKRADDAEGELLDLRTLLASTKDKLSSTQRDITHLKTLVGQFMSGQALLHRIQTEGTGQYIHRLKQDLKDTNAAKELLGQNLCNANKRIARLTEDHRRICLGFDRTIDRTKSKCREEVDQLSQELKSAREDRDSDQATILHLEDTLSQYQALGIFEVDDIAQLQQQNDSLNMQLEQLGRKHETSEAETETLKAELKRYQQIGDVEYLSMLQEQNAQLSDQLEQHRSDAEGELETVKTKLSQYEEFGPPELIESMKTKHNEMALELLPKEDSDFADEDGSPQQPDKCYVKLRNGIREIIARREAWKDMMKAAEFNDSYARLTDVLDALQPVEDSDCDDSLLNDMMKLLTNAITAELQLGVVKEFHEDLRTTHIPDMEPFDAKKAKAENPHPSEGVAKWSEKVSKALLGDKAKEGKRKVNGIGREMEYLLSQLRMSAVAQQQPTAQTSPDHESHSDVQQAANCEVKHGSEQSGLAQREGSNDNDFSEPTLGDASTATPETNALVLHTGEDDNEFNIPTEPCCIFCSTPVYCPTCSSYDPFSNETAQLPSQDPDTDGQGGLDTGGSDQVGAGDDNAQNEGSSQPVADQRETGSEPNQPTASDGAANKVKGSAVVDSPTVEAPARCASCYEEKPFGFCINRSCAIYKNSPAYIPPLAGVVGVNEQPSTAISDASRQALENEGGHSSDPASAFAINVSPQNESTGVQPDPLTSGDEQAMATPQADRKNAATDMTTNAPGHFDEPLTDQSAAESIPQPESQPPRIIPPIAGGAFSFSHPTSANPTVQSHPDVYSATGGQDLRAQLDKFADMFKPSRGETQSPAAPVGQTYQAPSSSPIFGPIPPSILKALADQKPAVDPGTPVAFGGPAGPSKKPRTFATPRRRRRPAGTATAADQPLENDTDVLDVSDPPTEDFVPSGGAP